MNESLNDKGLWELMETLKASNDEQAKYAKKQYYMSRITAISSLIILALVIATCLTVVPRVNSLFTNMEIVLADVQNISAELADADINQMITDMDHLVISSQDSIESALKKINDIDITSLNKAIRDLSSIIRPIAKVFGGD